MAKTAVINARIQPELKNAVEAIFEKLGLTTTQAVTLFFMYVKNYQGLPFEVRLPNETTRKAIANARKGNGLKKHNSVAALVKDLER
jgi:DNA-damage-inducible protein J